MDAMLFTCITCRVVFNHPEVQRSHYKSEWHRYNLKRKVAELPPVTEEKFVEKESQHKSVKTELDLVTYCAVCRKNFASQNAREAHQKSKKHQMAVKLSADKNHSNQLEGGIQFVRDSCIRRAALRQDQVVEDDEEVDDDGDDDEWESCDENEESTGDICPFCARRDRDVEGNLRHMMLRHSFFVPDPQYAIDVPGLISRLNRMVTEDCTCPWCGRSFGSAGATRRHVADRGHAKIRRGDGLFEYAEFYDYSSGGSGDEPWADPIPPEDDGWELVLPSGAAAGHRSLARYYRQNLRPHREQRGEGPTRDAILRRQAPERTRVGDAVFARRARSGWVLKLGLQNNKLRHRFRRQVAF